ncbi:MAG: hypothetical protein ACRD15_17510, partial [Vicinamibacterales bacterium]
PLIDFFRRGDSARDARLLAAQGALPTSPHEQLALLVLLSDDADSEIAATADATLRALPEAALRAFLAGADVPAEMKKFFADRGVHPAAAAAEVPALIDEADDEEDDEDTDERDGTPKLLSSLPIKKKIKLASKGTREQRAQLIRDPNKLVPAAVLSSPKLTDAEVESFAKMQNVTEEVLRVIGTNRTWLKNYGVVLGLVKNAKTPTAISMQLLQRINDRDMKMLAVDRNIPEALRLTARKFIVKGMK